MTVLGGIRTSVAVQPPPAPRKPKSRFSTHSSLGAGETKILTAIAQRRNGATRELLTVSTGYKKSSRDTYLQRLLQAGLIEKGGIGVVATPAGVEALGGSFEPLPTGDELIRWWIDQLPMGENAIFQILVKEHPASVSREAIGELTSYKKSSRDTYLQRLIQRRLVAPDGAGVVRLNGELFE